LVALTTISSTSTAIAAAGRFASASQTFGGARFVECEACAAKPPFNTRQVLVAFDQGQMRSLRVGKVR
jgi:hypothetical protein